MLNCEVLLDHAVFTLQQSTYTMTIAGSRSMSFTSSSGSGVLQFMVTTSPQQVDTPCTGSFNTVAVR